MTNREKLRRLVDTFRAIARAQGDDLVAINDAARKAEKP